MTDVHQTTSASSFSASATSLSAPAARVEYGRGRHAGVLLPLFSCASTRSWGIGEIGDLPIVARWLRAAGLDLLQMLPVNEMAVGQSSPYSAMSAMAIDPVYVSMADVPEFAALGGEASLSDDGRAQLEAVRRAPEVAYAAVRRLKDAALRASYAQFREAAATATAAHANAGSQETSGSLVTDAASDSARPGVRAQQPAGRGLGAAARARAFEAFRAEARWWLDDYALFRALHQAHAHHPWWTWDPALRAREPDALDRARAALADEIRYYAFVQWLAADQWHAAREAAAPVGFFGDLPFMVGADSADVWAHQDIFARDLSVGTPPDAFSATGQDWGLPAYRWDAMSRVDFRWLRARARRARELYDGFRIDHVIGFYRTYVRPIPLPDHAVDGGTAEGEAAHAPHAALDATAAIFMPAVEDEQRALGERVLDLFRESGACIIAEDLGTVPDFVRESLARLQVPGYRVLRWEREWHQPGQPFRHPAHYPARSLATTGTHDTDPLAIWWDTAPDEERRQVASLAGLPSHDLAFDDRVRDAVLRLLYASGSDLLVLPVQDLFGWRDRINTPATIGETNWTWRLPWPVDRLLAEPEARARADALRTWARETDRSAAALIAS